MSAADDIRAERIARHQRGDHNWRPGPYVPGLHPDTPASVIFVCPCGLIRRVRLPSEIVARLANPSPPVDDREPGS